MEDSKDTIIITDINKKTSMAEFSFLVCSLGRVKAFDMSYDRGEAIVTYESSVQAKHAAKELNGKDLHEYEIKAKMAKNHFQPESIGEVRNERENIIKRFPPDLEVNNAWILWLGEHTIRRYKRPKTGHGGKGGSGYHGYGKGQAGKAGEDRSGGKGGEGGDGGGCCIS